MKSQRCRIPIVAYKQLASIAEVCLNVVRRPWSNWCRITAPYKLSCFIIPWNNYIFESTIAGNTSHKMCRWSVSPCWQRTADEEFCLCAVANLTRIENFAMRPQCCVTVAFDDADVRLLLDGCTYCAFLS